MFYSYSYSPQRGSKQYNTVYVSNRCQNVGAEPANIPPKPPNSIKITPEIIGKCIGKWTYFWTSDGTIGDGWLYVKAGDESYVYGCTWIQGNLVYYYIYLDIITNYYI
ncbi:hypothetical protein AABM34_13050 [Lysinibacillus fusiformis]